MTKTSRIFFLFFFFCCQVKGYRYLEEDNSDESDSEKSVEEENDENIEEMPSADGEEEEQDAGTEGADSPRVWRRGARGQQHRWEDGHLQGAEEEEKQVVE